MKKLFKKITLLMASFVILMMLGVVNVEAEEYSEVYLKLFPNGKYETNSIPLTNEYDLDVFVYSGLFKLMDEVGLSGYDVEVRSCNDTYNLCDVRLFKYEMVENNNKLTFDETHSIEFVYNKYDKNVSKKMQKYLEIAQDGATLTDEVGLAKLYALTDLDLINYYTSIDSSDGNFNINNINNTINYISSLRKEFNNSNVTYKMDCRAGADIPLQNLSFGYFVVYYKNVAYGYVDPIGTQQRNVLYIPTDTENTTEAYIVAAKKRLKDYLGKDVNITVGDLRTNLDVSELQKFDPDYVYDWSKLGDESLMGDYYYKVELNGMKYDYVFIRDTKKMKKNNYLSRDIMTNISVATEKNIPLDTNVNVNEITDNQEYKNKLNKDNLYTIDISLMSNSTGKKITKLDSGKFKVEIPIPEYLKGQKLIVEYITQDGKIEKHDVVIENNIAVFETDHFSAYSLSAINNNAGTEEENPETSDEILLYVSMAILSILGLVTLGLYFKKHYN